MLVGSEHQQIRDSSRKTPTKTSGSYKEQKTNTNTVYSDEVEIEIGNILQCGHTHNYTVEEYLNSGRYGKVYRVQQKNKPNAESLACKVQSIKFENEADIHRTLTHKHIVKFLGTLYSESHCFILMEYCANGTLRELVRSRDGLTVYESRYFFRQIMLGVKYLHKMKIIHRDLKLDNIFLAKNMQIRIGDFGLAKLVSARQKKRTIAEQNRNHYKAPELFNGEIYSTASDIWAVGVILYKMVFNRGPFQIDENFMAATEHKFDFELEHNDELYDVLTDIFQPMHLRPDANRCLKSEFICGSKIPKKLPEWIRTEPIHEATDSDPSYK